MWCAVGYAFETFSRWQGRHRLEAGEYFFDHPVTVLQVYDMLAEGRVFTRELLVPEGYSMFDIADLVAQQGFTTRDDFLAAAGDPAAIHDLAPQAQSLEGFLFPATYEFPRHPSGHDMAAAMVKRFRQEWAGIESSAQPAGAGMSLPLQQTVTLASLVERETPKPDERPVVAGVFTNRLRQHIPLQCDPTVVYGMELTGDYSGLCRPPTYTMSRRTIRICTLVCRQGRLPIPARRRYALRWLPNRQTIYTLWPTRRVVISSVRRLRSTITMSGSTGSD